MVMTRPQKPTLVQWGYRDGVPATSSEHVACPNLSSGGRVRCLRQVAN